MKEHNNKNIVSEPCRLSESRDCPPSCALPVYTQLSLLVSDAQGEKH